MTLSCSHPGRLIVRSLSIILVSGIATSRPTAAEWTRGPGLAACLVDSPPPDALPRPGRDGGIRGPGPGTLLLRLPLLPVFQPLVRIPVVFLVDPEDVGVHERARPAPLRR